MARGKRLKGIHKPTVNERLRTEIEQKSKRIDSLIAQRNGYRERNADLEEANNKLHRQKMEALAEAQRQGMLRNEAEQRLRKTFRMAATFATIMLLEAVYLVVINIAPW